MFISKKKFDAAIKNAKEDAGKARLSLVPLGLIESVARIEEFEEKQKERDTPKLIKALKGGKGIFECTYCGNKFQALISNINRGRQHSCGCMKGKFLVDSKHTHGASKTRLYRMYHHIKERCESPTCKEYKWYGARGIQCKFNTFEEFRDYAMQNGYSEDLSCERIDVNGNYEPGNVSFIPLRMQARNTCKTDNRLCNLRIVSPKDSAKNMPIKSNNTTGTTGVSKGRGGKGYRAYITINKKQINLGTYKTKEEASRARYIAEEKYGFTHQQNLSAFLCEMLKGEYNDEF